MQVGDYVRTKSGFIDKVININDCREPSVKYALEQPSWNDDVIFIGDEDISKSRPDIIDLIEVGDILSYKDGSICRVLEIVDDYYLLKDISGEQYYEKEEWLEDIKSIVTKEQFESMEYRIEE